MEIVPESIEELLRNLVPPRDKHFEAMEKEAVDNHVPIIEPEVASFLKFLVAQKPGGKVLEVGTAIGYSALLMAEALGEGGQVITIERNAKRIERAKRNFAKSAVGSRVTIIEGDALEILPTIEGMFDVIFIDAAKGQYLHFFEQTLPLLAPKGILIADNVLYKGMVADDSLVVRRKKTLVRRLRTFLHDISNHQQLVSAIIPLGDGMAVAYKK